MTKREEKRIQKQEKRIRAEQKELNTRMRKKRLLRIVRFLSILAGSVCVIASVIALSGQQLLWILGALWFWTVSAWTNWMLNPKGNTESACQFGKSGLYQTVYYRNLSVAVAFSAISVILSLIILSI